jgi:cell division protein ZapA (FtsZ GTPase activity inhibitor)
VESQKEKVVFNLSGEKIPFLVKKEEEPIYITARDMLNDRLSVLKNKYSASANLNQLLTMLAVEALVDALKVNDRYSKLKNEIDSRLDSITSSLND